MFYVFAIARSDKLRLGCIPDVSLASPAQTASFPREASPVPPERVPLRGSAWASGTARIQCLPHAVFQSLRDSGNVFMDSVYRERVFIDFLDCFVILL